jgi:hypothetical protein
MIARYILPTAITDDEELQTAADWSTGNYRTHWARQPVSPFNIEWIGDEAALYVYTLDVPIGTDTTTVITQPLRWSVCEPTTSGGDFEMLRQQGAASTPGSYEQLAQTQWRNATQGFAQQTWLPASGDSHATASDPFAAEAKWSLNACDTHVVHVNGDVVSTNPYVQRKPASWYIIARYVQWRVNGIAVGPLHDLYDFYVAQAPLGILNSAITYVQPFPSGHSLWTSFGAFLENWNLDFAAGDTIEIDVWYEVAAQQTEAGERKLCVSVFRHYTNDDQQFPSLASVTPSSGYILRGSTGGEPWAGILTLRGIDMSQGFNPDTHTYDFTPTDGQFSFGKAQADGAFRFTVNSRRLEWSFAANAGSGCGGTSLWTWTEIGAGEWVLTEDNCVGGGVPVEPPLPEISLEYGSTETTSCDCSTSGSGDTWTIILELIYEYEIAYIKITFIRVTGGSTTAVLHYRPESTSDYVENVNDRWEGTMKCGPTGVFDHLGTTTFKLWQGVKQTAGAYPTTLPTAYAALAGILPTEIVVTKVAQ